MNIYKRTFDNDTFIYPKESGIFTAREYNFYNGGNGPFAVSQIRKNGREDILIVNEKAEIIRTNGNPLYPAAIQATEGTLVFWSEFDSKWRVKSNYYQDIPDMKGNLFVYSVCSTDNGIYLACELMQGNLSSDIVVLAYSGGKWEISEKLNSGGIFCKRPRIISSGAMLYVVWDGYGQEGYDIYCNVLHGGIWGINKRISTSRKWELKPSVTVDAEGTLWVAWLRNCDVIRDGIISKKNEVMTAVVSGDAVNPVHGNASEAVISLDMGLLPDKRYFGYHGLRRNPQIACCRDGIMLFWEMQRDEREIWENVENGLFLCMKYDGKKWGEPQVIQDGGNCFAIDSSSIITDTITYSFRGSREADQDIKFASICMSDLTPFELPVRESWKEWKPVELPIHHEQQTGLYWGDLHCHSIYSPDAEGYPDELFFYARDKAALDFCAVTDNDIYGNNILMESYLKYIRTLCRCFSKEGEFLAFAGYEWTYHLPGLDEPENFNHRTVIFTGDEITVASRAAESGSDGAAFVNTLAETETMWHAHHGIWKFLDVRHDYNAEIVSAWDNNMEKFGTVHEELEKGHVFGFMGASDNHRYIPGYGGALTGVFSRELCKGAFLEALKERRNYATCGSRPFVSVKLNGCIMGARGVRAEKTQELHIDIKYDRRIEFVDLMGDGKRIKRISVNHHEFKQKLKLRGKASSYYYLRIKLIGRDESYPHNLAPAEGNYIYTSPVWMAGNEGGENE